MTVLYNDNDRFCSAWLEELIKHGHLPEGRVDQRSIEQIQPSDCAPISHFFAGIGGWPYALQLAGWPTEQPVWTGSCPCQPFSLAGRKLGTADKRHLWPAWLRLIRECRPPAIFGEQVASRLGREWLAGVRVDLEALGYAVGAADLCAAGVGAPHIRQRLYWMADSQGRKAWAEKSLFGMPGVDTFWKNYSAQTGRCCSSHNQDRRRTPPCSSIVAYGSAENVARLSAIGNSIVPQVAAVFVRAVIEALEEKP